MVDLEEEDPSGQENYDFVTKGYDNPRANQIEEVNLGVNTGVVSGSKLMENSS